MCMAAGIMVQWMMALFMAHVPIEFTAVSNTGAPAWQAFARIKRPWE